MNVFQLLLLHRLVYMSCFHILEILYCDLHSQFSKCQLLSPTLYLLYLWELYGSIGNNTDSTCFQLLLVTGLTHIPSPFLHKVTYLVQNFSGAVVLTKCSWEYKRTASRKAAFRRYCCSSIKPFTFFEIDWFINWECYRDTNTRDVSSYNNINLQDFWHCSKGSTTLVLLSKENSLNLYAHHSLPDFF